MREPTPPRRERLSKLLTLARKHQRRTNEIHAQMEKLLGITGNAHAIRWLDDYCMGLKSGDVDDLLRRIRHCTQQRKVKQ